MLHNPSSPIPLKFLYRFSLESERFYEGIDVIYRTRDAVMKLELSDKTKSNYVYCGFGPILNFFASRGEEFYSPETLGLLGAF